MLVTIDVALITFLPFTLIVLGMSRPEAKRQDGSCCGPADHCRQFRQYADAHRQPAEAVSVWQGWTFFGAFVLLMLPCW